MTSDRDLPDAEQPAPEKPARRAARSRKAVPLAPAAPVPETPDVPETPAPPAAAAQPAPTDYPPAAQPGWAPYPYPYPYSYPYPPAPYPYPAAQPPYSYPYPPAPYPYPYPPAPYPYPAAQPPYSYPTATGQQPAAAEADAPLPWGQERRPTPWGQAPPPPAWPPAVAPAPAPYPPAPTPWPPAPAVWAPAPQPWPYGSPSIPLPFAGEPLPPSSQHPPAPRRPIASLAGRAAPRLYAAGWAFSLAGLAALVALIAASAAELTSAIPWPVRLAALEGSLAAITAGLGAAAIAQSRQRREDGWEDYFGPSPLLATGVMLALSTAVGIPLFRAAESVGIEMATSIELLTGLLINLACYVAVTHWLAARTGALTWGDMARPGSLARGRGEMLADFWKALRPPAAPTRLRSALGDIGLGLGLAVPAMIGTLILAIAAVLVLGLEDAPISGDSYEIVTDLDFWIVLFAAAVVAPIGEEIFFRGFLTNAWGRSLARNSALLRGAVLFASIHILNYSYDINALDLGIRMALLAMVVRLPIAWLLGWIYTSRRSLLASICLHGAYNGSLMVLAWWGANQ